MNSILIANHKVLVAATICALVFAAVTPSIMGHCGTHKDHYHYLGEDIIINKQAPGVVEQNNDSHPRMEEF